MFGRRQCLAASSRADANMLLLRVQRDVAKRTRRALSARCPSYSIVRRAMRAPVLLLAALARTSAAIVADVSGCAAVDQYKSSTWSENGLNKFLLAIEVSNWLNNGRVELRWPRR